jgi:hypothetical protein
MPLSVRGSAEKQTRQLPAPHARPMSVRASLGCERAAGVAIAAGLLLTACGAGGGGTEPHLTHTAAAVDPTDDASASIDAAKQRAAQQHASEVAAGDEHSEPASPERGIFDSAEAPFATVDFRSTSHWGGTVGGTAYVVYAGQDGQQASTGVVIVEPFGTGSGTTFHRMGGVGALTIVAAEGGTLVLRDARGGTHVFDVASRSFRV